MPCPVCGKIYLWNGLKNHIINTAKSEVWKGLKDQPHTRFFKKNKFDLPDRGTLVFCRIATKVAKDKQK
jgi:hypothetical protein